MNFINRSFKYIKSKKLKTILLSIIFILIGNLVIIGFGVSDASKNAKVLARRKMNPVVKYTQSNEFFYSEDMLYPDLKLADEMAKDKRVKAVSSFYSNNVYPVDFAAVKRENNEEYKEEYYEDVMNSVEIYFYRYTNLIEFEMGTYKLIDGKMFDNDDIKNKNKVAIIEEKLAKENNLKVGDFIEVKMFDDEEAAQYNISDEENRISIKIKGIYKAESSDSEYSMFGDPGNIILSPIASYIDNFLSYIEKEYEYYKSEGEIIDVEIKEETIYYNGFSYLLNDPDDLDKFMSDYQRKTGKGFKLDANDDTFKKYSKPLDTISLFSKIIVWALVINSIVIISLVTALTLKTREYEIGVLVSLGVQKWKVIMQLFLELLIIALVSFAIATVSGSLISKSVGKRILDFQTSSNNEEEKENYFDYYYGENEYFTNITENDILSEYNVTVNFGIIIKIFVVGVFIVFISILAPALMILRYNPKQILMSTN